VGNLLVRVSLMLRCLLVHQTLAVDMPAAVLEHRYGLVCSREYIPNRAYVFVSEKDLLCSRSHARLELGSVRNTSADGSDPRICSFSGSRPEAPLFVLCQGHLEVTLGFHHDMLHFREFLQFH
jgi:hypothetical protein